MTNLQDDMKTMGEENLSEAEFCVRRHYIDILRHQIKMRRKIKK